MHFEKLSVADAVEAALDAAGHLTASDAGAVAALRALALKIDMQDVYFEQLADQSAERGSRPPSVDNVSIPTFLKYCESLGLTPGGRKTVPGSASEPVKPQPTGLAAFAGLKAVN